MVKTTCLYFMYFMYIVFIDQCFILSKQMHIFIHIEAWKAYNETCSMASLSSIVCKCNSLFQLVMKSSLVDVAKTSQEPKLSSQTNIYKDVCSGSWARPRQTPRQTQQESIYTKPLTRLTFAYFNVLSLQYIIDKNVSCGFKNKTGVHQKEKICLFLCTRKKKTLVFSSMI